MKTLSQLREAMEHMKSAESLLKQVKRENKSLDDYYGYSLELMMQELNRMSDNSKGYQGHDTCLDEIMEAAGSDWTEDGTPIPETEEN
jgi:hypothetical protein